MSEQVRSCRYCGCTDADCSGCIAQTGKPCSWIDKDVCSACVESHLPGLVNGLRDLVKSGQLAPAPAGKNELEATLSSLYDAGHNAGAGKSSQPKQQAVEQALATIASIKLAPAASEVTRQLITRDAIGKSKYGATLDRSDLSVADWLQHMAEELLDAAGYALAAKREAQSVGVRSEGSDIAKPHACGHDGRPPVHPHQIRTNP